jgi:hypothetical protein
VIHYRQGSFSATRFQISIVLGLEGNGSLPHELLSQLIRHGEVRVWKDAGLTLLGRIIEDLDELEEEVEAFLAFAEEISLTLREAGAIRPASEAEVTQRLATMPTRLEVDYERLRRFWHRHRQASRLRSLLRGVSPEQARSHLLGIRDEEDRNYLRSVLVTELFQVDPERALAELRSITPGPERHQSILAVLERAASESRKDLATTIFGLWRETDARAPRYDSRCADILEIAATTLGRDAVLDQVPPDLDASVACEWLTLAFRTYPSTRGDLEWLRRLDSVLLDQSVLRSVSLDRLVELHDVLRRHGLPGRRRLIAAVAPVVKSHEYRSYYEDRLGIRLSDEDAAEPAPADIPERT